MSLAQPPRRPSSLGALDHTNVDGLLDALAERVATIVLERLPEPAASPAPWLDVDAAADYLACRPHRVYDLVAEGRVRCAKDGRRSLFRREWLDAYLLGEEGA